MDFEAMIEAGKSSAGSWSRPQLEVIGVQWPPKHGWRAERRGEVVEDDTAKRFIGLKDAHKKPREPKVYAPSMMFTTHEIEWLERLPTQFRRLSKIRQNPAEHPIFIGNYLLDSSPESPTG